MEDEQIVTLYWNRDETAIQETQAKYDRYLTKIACNILADMEDSRESVNDTYLAAWNSIPPQRPSVLSAYLAKLTRRISIDRFRYRTRDITVLSREKCPCGRTHVKMSNTPCPCPSWTTACPGATPPRKLSTSGCWPTPSAFICGCKVRKPGTLSSGGTIFSTR